MASDLNMKTRETTREFNRSHGSFELAFAPVLMALIGLWLDHKVGTTPLFVILFAVAGFVGVGLKIYYTYQFEMAGHAERLDALRHGRRAGVTGGDTAVGR